MEFKAIFEQFQHRENQLKLISVASCDKSWKPNSASKILISTIKPSTILFLEYKFTRTYANVMEIPQLSISFMDHVEFVGYRLTGLCTVVDAGEDYEIAKTKWAKLLVAYEADRIIERVKGGYSTHNAENALPDNFVIMKFTALEGAVIKPDRSFQANCDFDFTL